MHKGTLSFLTAAWLSGLAFAQQPALHVPAHQLAVNWTKDHALIADAVDSAVFVVRQDYVLAPRTGKSREQFGQDGKPYFGKRYGIGVMAEEKLWVTPDVTFPWRDDAAFKPHAAAMQPRRVNAHWKTTGRKDFSTLVYFTYDSTESRAKARIDYYQPARTLPVVGVSPQSRPAEGFLALLFPKAGGNPDSTEVERGILKVAVTWTNDGTGRVTPVPVREKLIGGALFVPRSSTGAIAVELAGLLRLEKDEWRIIPIREAPRVRPKPEAKPAPPPAANAGLTPAGKEDGKKKK